MQLVERAQVAAPPGRVWQAITAVRGERDTAVVRRGGRQEVRWTSRETVGDGEVDVEWWFRVAPGWNGTDVEHGADVPGRGAVTKGRHPVAARLVVELREVKSRAEAAR